MDYKSKPGTPEDMLEHFGVKGMKWGERRAHRQNMRSLDKASKARDKAADDKAVDSARSRVASGKLDRDWKAAKTKFKADKNVIGRREAKKALIKARDKSDTDWNLSQQHKHGAETVGAVLGVVGSVVLASLVKTAAMRRM